MSILGSSHDLALQTCSTKLSNPSGVHYRKRGVAKQRSKLSKLLREVRMIHKEMHCMGTDSKTEVETLIANRTGLPAKSAWEQWQAAQSLEANKDLTARQLLSIADPEMHKI